MGRLEVDDRGKAKIVYRPSGHPLTVSDLEAHMNGSGPVVGVYVLREDSCCKFASFDIDKQDLLATEKLKRVAVEIGFPDEGMMIVDSGNKGFHLHFFFADWISGKMAREFLKKVCVAADIREKDLELFPKQSELGQHSPYGNLIKLPLVTHPVSGRVAGIVNARKVVPAPATLVEAIVGASVAAVGNNAPSPPPTAPTVTVGASTASPAASGLVSEGSRNTTLTSWGGKLRRDGAEPAAILDFLSDFNQKYCAPPLSDQEVRIIASSVGRYPAGEGDMRLQAPLRQLQNPPEMGEVAGVELYGSAKAYNLNIYGASAEAQGTNWLIEEWLIKGQMHLTVGQEKLGKSTQAWHRVEAISTGAPYLGAFPVQLGRTLVMTEMNPETVHTLLAEDDIYPDLDQVRVMFLDEYEPKYRLKALGDAIAAWQPSYCLLDPIDECLGFEGDGAWSGTTVAAYLDGLRDLMRSGMCIEGLYHFNKAGKVANSYKFTSKVDHVYEVKGDSPSELTIKFRGRTRAIPKIRKVEGNGADGYTVTLLESMPIGRPSKTQQAVHAWLLDNRGTHGPKEIADAMGMSQNAIKLVLRRMLQLGTVQRPSEGLYETDIIYQRVMTPDRQTNSKLGVEIKTHIKTGSFRHLTPPFRTRSLVEALEGVETKVELSTPDTLRGIFEQVDLAGDLSKEAVSVG